ncbi:MAG TPA: tryptophan--tRNA ligase [Magnetospirillaceae bacterium]|nr:tryptophan--tRNA ligase [Magnetospirillaceae bacterium]
MANQPTHKPRVLTGLRANSNLTIANYLGAMLPMANLAQSHKKTHDFFMFVPDLHSFTTPINHDELHKNTIQNVAFYVAAGAIDLESNAVRVYRQSYVSQHSELAWILDCFTYMGELSRMTQFKDKAGLARDADSKELLSGLLRRTRRLGDHFLAAFFERDLKKTMEKLKNESVSVGLFNYPVLMAADILLYNATYIPLGDDQKQHLELTRDLALRINERFKNVFAEGVFATVPADWQSQLKFSGLDQGVRIRSLRNPAKKMSKSDEDPAGFVTLADEPKTAAKKIMAATTDSEGVINFDWKRQPGVSNLLQIVALLQKRPVQQVIAEWKGQTRYGDLKQAAAKEVGDFLKDFQTALAGVDQVALLAKIEADEAVARNLAAAQLLRVQQAVGLRPRP